MTRRQGPPSVPTVLVALWVLCGLGIAVAFPDDGMLGALVLGAVTAMLVGTGAVVGRVRRRSEVAASEPVPALPAQKSAAREPMARLAEAERALRDLMAQLRGAAVPRHVVDDAARIADETATRLRVIAAKVEAIEAAVRQSPVSRRAGLEDGARVLLGQLEQGLEGYRELIAAAGQLVLADTQEPLPDELIEATDRLAGFASALRDLSGSP